ncbi:putative ribonuclease H-like domain-containing protein [Tanacetum coccineum]
MDEFYGQKGIKKEYIVAKTLQQNGVAERKNRNLIEATRTMLADSLLPIVFWAEAVNTACYVLNRVLVTKPHNKTPYELIIGRAPSISFMRPFGCPVTILNTLDPLGKFDGKAEEGFLVRYSVHSKAFRVFNTKTIKVEENLHVNFLENKPNVVGQGPNWLFDIDSLINSMNYQPVTAGNQTNKNAGQQETNGNTGLKKNVNAGHTKEENVSTQQYIVFLLWSFISSSYKSSDDKTKDDTVDDDACKKTVQEPASEYDQALKNVLDKMMDQEKEDKEQSDAVIKEFKAQCNSQLLQEKITKASSTNSFNTISTPVNTVSASRTFSPIGPSSGPSLVPFGGSFPIDVANLPHDPLMHELEDTAEIRSTDIFGNAYDDHDLETLNTPYADQSVGAEADFNNMEPSTVVSPIPTTRVHSPHPKAHIIGDPKSIVQIRGMTKKNSREHAMISYIQKQRKTNHKDFQNCLFACFLSQHEPTKISQAFDDESWVEAMQEELLQFKFQKMDVKSTFLYVTIEEEVYVCQPPGFVDPEFPKKVYKVKKALLVYIKLLELDDIIFGSTKKSLCDEFKRSILSWLYDSVVVDVSEHVEYINPRKTCTMQKGAIMKDGIICGCCSKIVTFSKLEEHSGSKLGDPFPNIFLESGKSLMQCQIDAWEKLGELEKTDFYTVDVDGDDTCGLCDEGGNLICCDGCPSTLSPKQLRYRDHESCRPELDYQKLHCLGPILHDNSFLILADEGEYPLIEPLLLYGHGRDGTGGRSSGLIGGTLHLTDYANVTL